MQASINPHSMASWKDLWPVPAALIIFCAAALVGLPLYMHMQVSGTTGAYAPLYLYEHSPYDTIAVEAHYEPGAAPSDNALAGLREMLEKYTGKRVEVSVYGDLPKGVVNGPITEDNVGDIGEGILENYSKVQMGWAGGTIPIYIIYVNATGPAATGGENDTVVGISYRADSFFILKNYVDSEGLEKAVLIHETGHLFGLEHDDDPNCVMSTVMLENKSWESGGGPPTDFCANHQKELADRRQDLFYNARRAITYN